MGGMYRGLLCFILLLVGHGSAFAWGQPEAKTIDAIQTQERPQEVAPLHTAGEEEDSELVEEWDERAGRLSASDLASFWS